MTPGKRQLFIYYRVDAAHAQATIDAARRMQQALREAHAGLHAALMRRPHTTGPDVTLMETYALDAAVAPQGIDDALRAHIEAAAASLGGERHVEVFDACA